ncbi:hypothetical protein ACS0TY_011213 [Phlomoides rotata]
MSFFHTNKEDVETERREHNDTLLTLMQGSQNIFWTTRLNPNEDDFVLHPRMLDILQLMCFYGPARCGYMKLDRHHITALVERCHPETHTFHFSVDEVTITLQDTAIIWGLSIEGEPVICREPNRTREEWSQYCHLWLGFRPNESEMRSRTTILLS